MRIPGLNVLFAISILTIGALPRTGDAQIRFGSTLTLTGSGTLVGQNARDGMELARSEINNAGGINGERLEIIYEDIGEQDLKKAVSAAQKFIAIDKVSALFPMITEDAEVIWPIAHRSKIVTMAIYAGGRELTANKSLMFQVSSSDEIFGRVLTDYALKQGKRAACILIEQSAYALSIGNATSDYWKKRTSQAPTVIEYTPGTNDFRSHILKMRTNKCDALFLMTGMNHQGQVLSQIRAINWQPLKLGLDTSDDPNIVAAAGAGMEDLVYVKYLVATPEFKQKFKDRYQREAGVPAALAYDAVQLVSKAISQDGLSVEKLDAALRGIKAYSGASGELTMDADGTRHERQPQLWIFRNGSGQEL